MRAANILLLLSLIFSWPAYAFGQEVVAQTVNSPTVTVPLEGMVLERGTRNPIPDVNVFLLPHKIKAVTDSEGRFRFQAVPLGSFQFVINVTGYRRFELADEIQGKEEKSRRLFVERVRYGGTFETKIVAKREKRDDAQTTLTQQELITAPGSGTDALKAVQNLAGINRAPGFSGEIVIQGAERESTSYLIDGHEVPFIFHFGGLATVVFPEAIESVEYLSAGYGPEYGRALGGLVGVRIRSPRLDRWRGLAFADTINAGGLAEGPITKNSGLLLSFRQSYLGEVLGAVVGDNEDFDFTVAPRYTDITALYEWQPNRRVNFRTTGVVSFDKVEFLLKNPVNADPVLRGNFTNDTQFFRIIPQLKLKHEGNYASNYSVGFGWTKFKIETDTNVLNLSSWSITPRAEVTMPLNRIWTAYLGTDNRVLLTDALVQLPNDYEAGGVFNPFGSGEEVFVDTAGTSWEASLYFRNTVRWPGRKWTLSPNGRFEYFSTTNETFFDPRLGIAYDIDPSLRLRANGGRYHQAPQPRETANEIGNPNLKTPSAWHLSVGADKDFRKGGLRGFQVSGGGFFRWFDDLVVRSNQIVDVDGEARPEYWNNSATGTAFGGEATTRYNIQRWDFRLAYTLLQSRRTEPEIGTYRAEFDQTHNINFLAGVNLPRNWRISTRVRYVTGNPYTPVVGSSYDADANVFIPERGEFYSERLDDFFQWDVRVDKRWIYRKWILSLYLDLQNATNRENTEAVRYAYDYSTFTTVKGLPIIPQLGLKGEF